jgi:hypothetical protein
MHGAGLREDGLPGKLRNHQNHFQPTCQGGTFISLGREGEIYRQRQDMNHRGKSRGQLKKNIISAFEN